MQVKTYHIINNTKSMLNVDINWKNVDATKVDKSRCFSIYRGRKTKISEDEYNHPRIQKMISKKLLRVSIKTQNVQVT